MVENNIVKGNQPSICLGLGGKIKCFSFCYGMSVLVCFTDLTLGSKTASDESQMCKVTLWGMGKMWVASVLQVLVAVRIITTFITPEAWGGSKPRRVSDLVSSSSDLRAHVLFSGPPQ